MFFLLFACGVPTEPTMARTAPHPNKLQVRCVGRCSWCLVPFREVQTADEDCDDTDLDNDALAREIDTVDGKVYISGNR